MKTKVFILGQNTNKSSLLQLKTYWAVISTCIKISGTNISAFNVVIRKTSR